VTSHPRNLVSYRLEKARETLEDAYYSCFFAVSALLIQCDLSSSKHSGVRGLFNQHFVKTGKISKDLAKIFNDLFERRKESDYVDFVHFEEGQVLPWVSRVEEFVDYIASLVDEGQRG
jgi:uncharacterized protein (UPF0332 family)